MTKIILVILLMTSLFVFSNGEPAVLSLNWLSDLTAVCNDGTRSAYYFTQALDFKNSSSKNLWLFYLQGGGQCYSNETCSERSEDMKSSNWFSQTISMDGIFNEVKFYSALHTVKEIF